MRQRLANKLKNNTIIERFRADFGPAERWQHSGRILEETERAGVCKARALEEGILDVLLIKQLISKEHHEAALRFKKDFHEAGLGAKLSSSYSGIRMGFSAFGPWDERTDAQEAAYQRWRNALKAMGKIHSDTIITAACYDVIPAPDRLENLSKGLERLVKWYGG